MDHCSVIVSIICSDSTTFMSSWDHPFQLINERVNGTMAITNMKRTHSLT